MLYYQVVMFSTFIPRGQDALLINDILAWLSLSNVYSFKSLNVIKIR